MKFYNKNRKNIKIFGVAKNKWKISEIRKIFKNKNVYITFDVDGFDSSLMPATGTPGREVCLGRCNAYYKMFVRF